MVNASPDNPPDLREPGRLVRELAAAAGFGLCGIAPAEPSDHAPFVRDWIAAGRHGEMQYLADRLALRLDPRELMPGARSIIAVADFYHGNAAGPKAGKLRPAGGEPRARAFRGGRVARYAWGDDYHKVMKKRLHALADALRERFGEAEFRCTVDTAPILEREHAARAGLGWVGKHTLLLHPRFGSYMLLGMIVTTVALPTSADDDYPGHTVPPADRCGTCTRCIDACPTQCIANPDAPGNAPGIAPDAAPGTADQAGHRTLDASRCISYLTLEHRGPIAADLHAMMGDWVAGCDVCQQVCPYNQHVEASPIAFSSSPPDDTAAPPSQSEIRNPKSGTALPIHPRYEPRAELAEGLDLLELLDWSADDRQRVFQGSALKRMKLDMVRRNALIAAGNAMAGPVAQPDQDRTALRERVEQIADDPAEPALVRNTARQVLGRL